MRCLRHLGFVLLVLPPVVGCGGSDDDEERDGAAADADAAVISDAAPTPDAPPPDAWLVDVPAVERFGDYVRYLLPGLGGLESAALDINDSGQIVGLAQTATGEFHACLWTREGVIDLAADLGDYAAGSYAEDINELGHVLISRHSDEGAAVFVWQAGTIVSTGLAFARAINESGAVIGQILVLQADGYHRHAGLWQEGVLQDLGTFGARDAHVGRVLEDGRAFIATEGTLLPRRVFQVAGGDVLEITSADGLPIYRGPAINGLGQVVARTAEGFFLWEAGVATPLADIPLTFEWVYGFTSSGWLELVEGADEGHDTYLRAPDGALVLLQPSGAGVWTRDLDEAGNVVGQVCGGCEDLYGWPGLWRVGDAGLATSLGPIGGAEAMNAVGDIVGWVPIDIDYWMSRAAVWRYEPE